MDNNDSKINFSIIVPVYNTEKYVEKCLNSIKEAIDLDCEVIIINDGSTDNSEKVILDYIGKLSPEYKERYHYVAKENKGLADTKNVGIEMAKGCYISVVDSDDYISSDFYTIARKYIAEGYDMIIYDLYVIYEKPTELYHDYVARAYKDETKDLRLGVLYGAMQGSSCNKIIKKELYEPYQFPVNKEYEDAAVTPFILMDAEKIKYIPYPLYYYLQREKSIVATNTYITAFYKICDNIAKELQKKESYEKYDDVINEFYINRMLEILDEDYRKNKKEFSKNIEVLSKEAENAIRYILEKRMMYEKENLYSPRQKGLVDKIYTALSEKDYKAVKKVLFMRGAINYVRRIFRSFKQLIKCILGGE